MIVKNLNDVQAQKIETYPHKGEPMEVKEVWIRWLSKVGPDGAPEYGLRHFTIGPAGEIPLHNHLYYQTMYILSGRVRCFRHDSANDEIIEEKVLGPTDFIYVPTMEIHSLKNASDTEPVTFLCCIANVREQNTL